MELLKHNEGGVAFDLVVTQPYEYDIKIDGAFLEFANEIADAMKIDRGDYDFPAKRVTRG